MEFSHRSVLLNEAVEGLNIRPDGIYVDGTLGGAGHSLEIVKRLTTGRLIGIDQDEDAIGAAKERLKGYEDRVTVVKNNFENVRTVLDSLGIEKVDGILLDLGVSSYQFDEGDRGFSYRTDAPLDMRMDRQSEKTAADIVNGYSESELYRIIRDYGEEPFAKNIAKHIVRYRDQEPIQTTLQLVEIIKSAIPAKIRAKGGHPAKQTFQAIRIECNRELDVLSKFLLVVADALQGNGRIAIITFHSLEDRIVKNAFRTLENPCTCPKNLPCVCGKKPLGKVITRKPILPSEEEMIENPRSKSAKLRIFEKM
jgi:16S rRNA (cytosine1402-N4)-methyltransferase